MMHGHIVCRHYEFLSKSVQNIIWNLNQKKSIRTKLGSI